jgi:hypothetical protein
MLNVAVELPLPILAIRSISSFLLSSLAKLGGRPVQVSPLAFALIGYHFCTTVHRVALYTEYMCADLSTFQLYGGAVNKLRRLRSAIKTCYFTCNIRDWKQSKIRKIDIHVCDVDCET